LLEAVVEVLLTLPNKQGVVVVLVVLEQVHLYP
jgi:hypothetical protein